MKAETPKPCARLERENRRLRSIVDSLVMRVGLIKLDRLLRTVYVDGQLVPLPPASFTLLEQLMMNQDEVIPADPILIHKLRNQLGPAGDIIQVVRGQGYTMSAFEVEK